MRWSVRNAGDRPAMNILPSAGQFAPHRNRSPIDLRERLNDFITAWLYARLT